MNKAIITTTINGQIALVSCSRESLLMPQATNRHAPTGGVIKARLRESTMIMPKWIGWIPRLLTAMGWRIGPQDNQSSRNIHEHSNNQHEDENEQQYDMGVITDAQ